ncbi:MAG: dUTP diphosphatase [Erysipelotrichia bacterium]|nr:dUTP diphosphatase [Erysipelotrichia bacterium]
MLVKVKKLNKEAIIPFRGSKYAAGYDLYSCDELNIASKQTVAVSTGIAIEIPQGYFGAVFARSGLASKEGLRPANCVGVIDCDYRGELKVMLHNDSAEERQIFKGERIAQLVILPYFDIEFMESEQLDSTERGEGGFGSSGK